MDERECRRRETLARGPIGQTQTRRGSGKLNGRERSRGGGHVRARSRSLLALGRTWRKEPTTPSPSPYLYVPDRDRALRPIPCAAPRRAALRCVRPESKQYGTSPPPLTSRLRRRDSAETRWWRSRAGSTKKAGGSSRSSRRRRWWWWCTARWCGSSRRRTSGPRCTRRTSTTSPRCAEACGTSTGSAPAPRSAAPPAPSSPSAATPREFTGAGAGAGAGADRSPRGWAVGKASSVGDRRRLALALAIPSLGSIDRSLVGSVSYRRLLGTVGVLFEKHAFSFYIGFRVI